MAVIKPMKHQNETLAFMGKTDVMFDMSSPGTGKTFVQIMAFAKRHKRTKKCMLVLGPRTILDSAWKDDFKKFAPHLRTSVARAENRETAFAVDADVYITNVDAVKWLVKQKPAFFKKFDTIALDESSSMKHSTSQRSKALNKIKKFFKYRSAMSATPNSNTICDIWNQVLFLDDGARLGSSFYAFRSSVCVPKQIGPRKEMINWIDKDGAEEAVFGLIADITIRHEFDKCVDIPATHIYTMAYHMSEKQLKAYQQMEATQIASLIGDPVLAAKARLKGTAIPPEAFKHITAINAAAVTTKLLQISSGAVYESPGKYHVIDPGRYELVMDMVVEREHPIVFFLWKHQRDELTRLADLQGKTYCVIDGDASDKERQAMMQDYQNGLYDVAFCHPKSAAHGLTFTRGNSIIWASPTYDAEWFNQGNKRQARIGQKKKTEVITIIAPGTREEKVYASLTEKGFRMGNLLTLLAA